MNLKKDPRFRGDDKKVSKYHSLAGMDDKKVSKYHFCTGMGDKNVSKYHFRTGMGNRKDSASFPRRRKSI